MLDCTLGAIITTVNRKWSLPQRIHSFFFFLSSLFFSSFFLFLPSSFHPSFFPSFFAFSFPYSFLASLNILKFNTKQSPYLQYYLLGNSPQIPYRGLLLWAFHFHSFQSSIYMVVSIKKGLRKSAMIYYDFSWKFYSSLSIVGPGTFRSRRFEIFTLNHLIL